MLRCPHDDLGRARHHDDPSRARRRDDAFGHRSYECNALVVIEHLGQARLAERE
jgi:hypothetical protein